MVPSLPRNNCHSRYARINPINSWHVAWYVCVFVAGVGNDAVDECRAREGRAQDSHSLHLSDVHSPAFQHPSAIHVSRMIVML